MDIELRNEHSILKNGKIKRHYLDNESFNIETRLIVDYGAVHARRTYLGIITISLRSYLYSSDYRLASLDYIWWCSN